MQLNEDKIKWITEKPISADQFAKKYLLKS